MIPAYRFTPVDVAKFAGNFASVLWKKIRRRVPIEETQRASFHEALVFDGSAAAGKTRREYTIPRTNTRVGQKHLVYRTYEYAMLPFHATGH